MVGEEERIWTGREGRDGDRNGIPRDERYTTLEWGSTREGKKRESRRRWEDALRIRSGLEEYHQSRHQLSQVYFTFWKGGAQAEVSHVEPRNAQ